MATNLDSVQVAGGDDVLATQYNVLRKDVLQNAGDYAVSAGAANAYTLAIDAQIAAYNEGQVFKFKANFDNTGPATLNVNGIGAKTIKKFVVADLSAGDILTDQVVEVIYDGTNLQMKTPATNDRPKFGGDGSDGALSVLAGTTTINLGGATIKVLNYTSINVAVGATVDFSNPHANGTIIIIRYQGTCVIAGTFDFRGTGPADGGTAIYQLTNTSHAPTASTAGGAGSTSGDGTNGTSGAGGSALDYLETIMLTDSEDKLQRKAIFFEGMYGQVAPTAGTRGLGFNNGAGIANQGAAGANGRSGTFVIFEGGSWNFTGTINDAGQNGTNGSNGTTGQVIANQAGGGGGGGGGGGAGGNGGWVISIYNNLISNAGTINTAGGTGGNGGTGGTGGVGFNGAGGSAGGGGGGGASGGCAGTKTSAGRVAVNGLGGKGSVNNNDGRGGSGGTGGSSGPGGGTFMGGQGSAGAQGSLGNQGLTGASPNGGAGGAGGSGGAGAVSIGGLVVKNYWF